MKATNSYLQKSCSVKTRQSSTSVKLGTRQGATAPLPWPSSITSLEYIQSGMGPFKNGICIRLNLHLHLQISIRLKMQENLSRKCKCE